MNPLAELIKSRIREFVREPGYVFWVFGFPLLTALGLGLAFRSNALVPPRIAVTEAVATKTLQALSGSPRLQTERLTRPAAARALSRTKVDLVVDQPGPEEPLVFSLDTAQEKRRLLLRLTKFRSASRAAAQSCAAADRG